MSPIRRYVARRTGLAGPVVDTSVNETGSGASPFVVAADNETSGGVDEDSHAARGCGESEKPTATPDLAETIAGTTPGAGDAETEVVPPVPPPVPDRAWSAEEPEAEPIPASWGSVWRLAGVGLAVVVVAVLVAVVGWLTAQHRSDVPSLPSGDPTHRLMAPLPPTTTPVAQPSLDGTYRIIADLAKATYRGNAIPPRQTGTRTNWYAWRSHCDPVGCTADGVELDPTDHTRVSRRNLADSANFINGQWVEVAVAVPSNDVSGCDGSMTQFVLRPQPDGSLTGAETITVQGTCGSAGNTTVIPFTAIREGPRAPGILQTEVN